MFKSERRQKQRDKKHTHRVHSNFQPQINAMLKREEARKERNK